MRSIYVVMIVFIIVILVGIFFLNRTNTPPEQPINNSQPSPSPSPQQEINIKASFTIITDNITRSFINPKYHNKSPDVFITSDNPTVINVKKPGITWSNFFDTLPMKLTKDCLITGDGERLCDTENGSLRFYLNNIEDMNLLDKEIQNNNQALIKFISS